MTNSKYEKKYPIGTKVKYVGCSTQNSEIAKDVGKVGKVVGYHWHNPIIFLSESKHMSCYSTEQTPASWETGWCALKILPQKNQQLLFDFAYEKG